MDFLGLSYLGVIQNTVNMVKDQLGVTVDISHVDTEEPAVYKLISSGDTIGVFQMESGGMKGVAAGVQPTSIEDLTAIISLYRPGTIKAGGIEKYIDRKNGKEKAVYYHPSIEGVLKPTYGIIVYQEQIMQIANRMAGLRCREADILRKGVSKKKADILAKQRAAFVEKSIEKGVPKKTADDVFALIDFFAGVWLQQVARGRLRHHGLPHGVAQSPLSASSTSTALMNSGIDSEDRLKELVAECRSKSYPQCFRQISTDPKSCSPSRHSPTAPGHPLRPAGHQESGIKGNRRDHRGAAERPFIDIQGLPAAVGRQQGQPQVRGVSHQGGLVRDPG